MVTLLPVVESSEVEITDFATLIALRFAKDVLPVPPLVDEANTLFVNVPAMVAVTVTVTLQLLLAGIDAPVRLTLFPLGAAVTDPPTQVVEALGTAAFCIPVGYVSIKATFCRSTVLTAGLVMANVIRDVPLTAIGLVPNVFKIAGGATTVTDALAVLPIPPFEEVTFPVRLFLIPAVVPVAVTSKVQLLVSAIVPALRDIVSAAGELSVVVNMPPHWVEDEFETSKPGGNVSVNATSISPTPVFGFVMVKLNVVVPFNGIVAAPNDLLIEGGARTVTVLEPVLLVSSTSGIRLSGSTVAVFTRLPGVVGEASIVTVSVAPGASIIDPPLFTIHARVPLLIAQVKFPKIPPPMMITGL